MKIQHLIPILFLAAFCTVSAQTNRPPANDVVTQAKLLEDLVSTNARVRLEAAMLIDRQQEQMLDNLAVILKMPIPDDQKMDAAALLGENKSSFAIPYLVNHLEWEDNLTNPAALSAFYGDLITIIPLPKGIAWEYTPPTNSTIIRFRIESDLEDLIVHSPVNGSLARIGADAIPALLDRISQSDDEGIILDCLLICNAIEGEGKVAMEVTQLRLQDRLQKETDPKKKERLQAALDIVNRSLASSKK